MAKMTGRDAIAKVLKASGVEYVFGMGAGIPPLIASLIKSGIKMVTVRNEMAASLMATGYSRLSGKPGICVVGDIGAGHLAAGLREAYGSSNPVVTITTDGSHGTTWRSTPHFIDQEPVFKPITKWTVRAEVLKTLPDIIRRALEVATTGSPGPVSVIVPIKLLLAEADFEIQAETEAIQYPRFRIAPEAESIQRATSLLIGARRPAIVAGGGILQSRASEELRELAEVLVAPVATSQIAQAVFPNEHPLSLGVVGDAANNGRGRVANKVVGEADVVLLVGTKMDGPTTRSWSIPSPNSKLIHIDIDPAQVGNNCPIEVGIVADAKLALQALKDALQGKVKKTPSIADAPIAKEIQALMKEWCDEYDLRMNSNDVPIKHPRLFREIQNFISPDNIVVLDAGSSSYWAANYLDVTPDTYITSPRGFPAIGSGFALAIGAQVAVPDKRVICISGDGGFGYTIMELETCVRLNLPVVCIVINNQSFGMERGIYVHFEGKIFPEATSFSPQDFSKIAQAYNCFGVRVEKPQDIRGAIAAALASGKPSIVEVMTDAEESESNEVPWWGATGL